jgi:hypothetical protein
MAKYSGQAMSVASADWRTQLEHVMKYTKKKRAGEDRRNEDNGPPAGWSERRHTVERRKPEVRELSFAEWIASMRQKSYDVQ